MNIGDAMRFRVVASSLSFLAVLGAARPDAAHAQVAGRPAEVVALGHFRDLAGPVRLDPRVAFPAGGGRFGEVRESDVTRQTADLLEADIAELSEVLVCRSDLLPWKECRLEGAKNYIAVSDAIATPDGAVVRVLRYWSTGWADRPVAASVWRIELSIRNGVWEIVSARAEAVT